MDSKINSKTDSKINRKKMDKNHMTRLRTGGIVAALTAAFAVFLCLVQIEKNVLTQYEKGVIYVAAKEIPKGQMITEDNRSEYLAERELDKSCIPVTALSDPGQYAGLAAVFDIEQGVLLTAGMFRELEDVWDEIGEPVIVGFKAEDICQVAGGVLRAGDRIHIYCVEDGKAVLAWDSVYVQQVFDISGKSIANGDTTTAAQRLNLYFDKGNAEAFYTGLARGRLWAVKACD